MRHLNYLILLAALAAPMVLPSIAEAQSHRSTSDTTRVERGQRRGQGMRHHRMHRDGSRRTGERMPSMNGQIRGPIRTQHHTARLLSHRSELRLTAEQVSALEELQRELESQNSALQSQIRALLEPLMREAREYDAAARDRLSNILTEEQLQRSRDLDRMPRHEHRTGHRRGEGSS